MISQFYVSTISSWRQSWAFRDTILKNCLKMTSLEVYLQFQNSTSYSQISLMIHKESSIAGIKNFWFRFTTWNVVNYLAALGFMPHCLKKKAFVKKKRGIKYLFLCLFLLWQNWKFMQSNLVHTFLIIRPFFNRICFQPWKELQL